MMKKTLFFTLLALLTASCTKDGNQTATSPRETVRLEFRIPVSAKTRTLADDEANIVSLDALAFRSDGKLDSYARTDSPEIIDSKLSVSLSATKGETLSWFVIANAPSGALEEIATKSALESKRALLSENASDAFLMISDGTGTYNSASQTVNVSLTRMVSKVSVASVTAAFLTGTMASAAMTLDAVYLINAAGSVRYDLTPVAETWYNRFVADGTLGSPVAGFLYRDASSAALSASNRALDYVFYACPNPTANSVDSSTAPEWSARNTRLVLETSVNGAKNYYPITLPAMRSNYEYAIREVVLNGYGSSAPDRPVVRNGITYSVSVNPWETETRDITME